MEFEDRSVNSKSHEKPIFNTTDGAQPGGQYLASGKDLGKEANMIRDAVWLWDINRGEVVKKLTQFPEYSLVTMDYSADGNYISASGNYYTKIWKIK